MNLNYCVKRILAVGGWMVNTCFVWRLPLYGAFSRNQRNRCSSVITANVGDQIQGTADEVRVRSRI